MILNSKQLEELETLTSSAFEFDEDSTSSDESESNDDGAESAMAWRRGMLEKALSNLRKAQSKEASSAMPTKSGALWYDEAKKCFARVKSVSNNGFQVIYSSGEVGLFGSSNSPKSSTSKKPATVAKPSPAPKATKEVSRSPKKPSPVKVEKQKTKKSASSVSLGKSIGLPTDINTFIKQKFQSMSNKELAKLTGLSEHTIRRKLGEWGMRRAK